jgi:hypothetical protein
MVATHTSVELVETTRHARGRNHTLVELVETR